MSQFKIGVCQMIVRQEKNENIKNAQKWIRSAAENGAQVVVLPEMFNCPYESKYFPDFAETFPGKTTNALSDLAQELDVYVVGGSIPEKEGKSIYNTSYIFSREGDVLGRHRKMHLFDIDVEGGIQFKESDTLVAGENVTVVEIEYCKIGIAICYDMRFPELIRLMALEGAQVIVVPAAFNMTTGPAHWEITMRTRALDNQVYFIAASSARNLKASYHSYGHSAIIDPWGTIINKADEKEGIISGKIDPEKIKKVRNELPLLKHRRTDKYKEEWY